ncbi:hypothetical protein [Streptomyces brasiliscabiei]|uniref:Uncharacterized protein n=1 Tax=Streptomyces brasiliscabiei TaxID=2736302 RepID=A0ABU8GUL0_9ACTN
MPDLDVAQHRDVAVTEDVGDDLGRGGEPPRRLPAVADGRREQAALDAR